MFINAASLFAVLLAGQTIEPRRPLPGPPTPPPPPSADEIHRGAPVYPQPVPQIDPVTLTQAIADEVSKRVGAIENGLQQTLAQTRSDVADLKRVVNNLNDQQVINHAQAAAVQKVEPKKSLGKYAAPDSSGQWWYADSPEEAQYAVQYYNRRLSGVPVRRATQSVPMATATYADPPAATQAAPATAGASCYSAPPPTSYAAPPAVSYAAPAITYAAPAVTYAAPAMTYAAPALSYEAPAMFAAPATSAAPGFQVETYRRGLFGRERRTLFSGGGGISSFSSSVCGPFGCN